MFWFIFYHDNLLIQQRGDGWHVPCTDQPPVPVPAGGTLHSIAFHKGIECKSFAVQAPVPDGETWRMIQLRKSYDQIPVEEYQLAGKASIILHWDENTRYCPHCGIPMQQISAIGKKCPECRQEFYPHLAPAIIVRLSKGDSILMVRAHNFRGTFYGLVAGFVEPGETLEQCVEREVMEETGLQIKNVRYFGSQPWPYPSGIMIGFTAEYAGGTIRLQKEELSEGQFFSRDNMPELPRKLSIARRLVDAWLEQTAQKATC